MFDKNYKIDDLMEFDEKYMLNSHPLRKVRFAYGENSKLYTPCSKQFIDFGSGNGNNTLGHGHPKIIKDIAEQVRDLIGLSDDYLIEPAVLLAKKLIDLSGYNHMKVCFGNSRREMIEYAIRVAREFGKKNNRYKIIALGEGLDGYDGILYAKDIDGILDLVDSSVCGVFIEIENQQEDFFASYQQKIHNLAKLLKEKNIPLMVDESQSGVYRLGEIFASKVFKINPDILVVGEGLGGGIPIAAMMCAIKNIPLSCGGIFEGSFVGTRAALSVLGVLEEEHKSGNLAKSIESFDFQLEGLFRAFPNLFEKRMGMGLRLDLVAKTEEIATEVVKNAFEEQLLIPKETKNVVRFLPALNISTDEIKEGFERLYRACEKI